MGRSGPSVSLPRVITHDNIEPLLVRLAQEPEFQPGKTNPRPADAWYRKMVFLEVPIGELARDGLTTLALVGHRRIGDGIEVCSIDGTEGFDAQGIEGKVRIHKDLFSALMNLRDLIPRRRGRIVVNG